MKERCTYATALSYGQENDAPIVEATGENEVAERIIAIAKRYSIPVVRKPELARALVQLDEQVSIPQNFFQAIAVIFNELEETAKNLLNRGASAPRL